MEVDGTTISIRLFWSNVYVSEDVLFVISLAAYSAMVKVKDWRGEITFLKLWFEDPENKVHQARQFLPYGTVK